jgi:hypothetical protein
MLPFQQSLELFEQEHRIRTALGFDKGPIPNVGIEWLRKYYEYMTAHLSLPFAAQLPEESSIYRQPSYAQVTVVAITDPDKSTTQEYDGLMCKALKAEQELEVPLVDLEVDDQNPNFQLIEDYWYWIWNWRFDPRI